MEIKLLYKEKTPENIIAHSKAVCNKAMEIASHFENVDKDLIKKVLYYTILEDQKVMESIMQ